MSYQYDSYSTMFYVIRCRLFLCLFLTCRYRNVRSEKMNANLLFYRTLSRYSLYSRYCDQRSPNYFNHDLLLHDSWWSSLPSNRTSATERPDGPAPDGQHLRKYFREDRSDFTPQHLFSDGIWNNKLHRQQRQDIAFNKDNTPPRTSFNTRSRAWSVVYKPFI